MAFDLIIQTQYKGESWLQYKQETQSTYYLVCVVHFLFIFIIACSLPSTTYPPAPEFDLLADNY